jgi:hypothetical protein
MNVGYGWIGVRSRHLGMIASASDETSVRFEFQIHSSPTPSAAAAANELSAWNNLRRTTQA